MGGAVPVARLLIVTGFFIPAVGLNLPEDLDDAYAALACFAQCALPAADRRIYSMTFAHDGEEWTATVGEQLGGTRTRRRSVGGPGVDRTEPLHDRAAVVAVFAGSPYMVVTDARPLTPTMSHWVNPFMATNDPLRLEYFAS